MAQIPFDKNIFSKEEFDKLVDKKFKQLVNQIPGEVSFTVDNFFELYDNIFDEIPREGNINSHRYILNREAEYLGINIEGLDVQALLDEVTSLRQELLDTNKTLLDLTKQ